MSSTTVVIRLGVYRQSARGGMTIPLRDIIETLWRHRRRHHFHMARVHGRRWYSYAPGDGLRFVASGTGALVQPAAISEDDEKVVEDDRHGDLNNPLKTVLLGVAIVLGQASFSI